MAAFCVGKIVECKAHPNADRLKVCVVDQGKERVQVVCGAPNAREGLVGIFAPDKAWIPGTETRLKSGKIRGQISNGMLLSERELGLSNEHDGIIELSAGHQPGQPCAQALSLNDSVIDIEVTPNRGDMLGVRGIARDLAAAGLGQMHEPAWISEATTQLAKGTFGPSPIDWKIEENSGCQVVRGYYFRGLTNGDSPAWMAKRLRAIGQKPISALVDITNYIMFDVGRPLHFYDARKLQGDSLVMRKMKEDTAFTALNGKDYDALAGLTVIHDSSSVQGLGGVIGGMASGCSFQTTDAFLETALFEQIAVSMAGRRLGIETDARYRFERNLDPQSVNWGSDLAAGLVIMLCGGEVSDLTQAGEVPKPRRSITLSMAKVASLGGVDIPEPDAKKSLIALGFDLEESGHTTQVYPPTYRRDVTTQVCLVEEILRLRGLDAIPSVSLPAPVLPSRVITSEQKRRGQIRRALAIRGLYEAVTWAFIDRDWACKFGGGDESLALLHPISSDWNQMRPSLLPNLLEAAQRNLRQGEAQVGLFEIGGTYHSTDPDGQEERAAGLRVVRQPLRNWAGNEGKPDVFSAKQDVLATLGAVGVATERIETRAQAPGWYHPGRSGVLALGPRILAHFGELHPEIGEAMGFGETVAIFEILLAELPPFRKKACTTKSALERARFQAVWRDFAFVISTDSSADKVLHAAKSADKKLIDQVRVFDRFGGKGIEAGKVSLGVSVRLQPRNKTLTDKEIEEVSRRIVDTVTQKTGAVLRS